MTGPAHPRHGLDDLIHTPVRLSVMSALSTAEKIHFGYLRDWLEVSDSLLSKHLTVLEDAGYLKAEKGYIGKRPRTWFSLTETGRRSYEQYLRALRGIVDAEPPATETDDETSADVR